MTTINVDRIYREIKDVELEREIARAQAYKIAEANVIASVLSPVGYTPRTYLGRYTDYYESTAA